MELLYFRKKHGLVSQGGTSRDNAFYSWLKNIDINKKIIEIEKKNFFYRVINLVRIVSFENKILFFHLSSLSTLFPSRKLKTFFGRKVFELFLKKISKNNRVIIEINDLKWEQAKDLELPIKKREFKIQKILLGIKKIEYVFASNEMRNYAIKEYGVCKEKTFVCINGGIPLEKNYNDFYSKILPQNDKIKFVYAGTLAKGRQINEIIKIFKGVRDKNVLLILMGEGGEWLQNLSENIIYLGNFEESIAHKIVSLCDIGIVPYDSERFYYNLCYPTKNSFYITSGLPLLITPLKESLDTLLKEDVLFVKKIEEWESFIKKISSFEIKIKKEKVIEIKKNFEWNFLLKNLFEEMKLM